jgi:hypothetical protein
MPYKPIKSFKLTFEERGGSETDFITKTTAQEIFDFRAFLNLGMLMEMVAASVVKSYLTTDSERKLYRG